MKMHRENMINKCEKNIGIDIGSSSVKAVCLNMKNIVDGYGIADLPMEAGDTEVILALKKVVSQDCRGCDVVMGLRGLDVITKSMTVDIKPMEEMEKYIETEIMKQVPVEKEEVQISWQVIDKKNNKLRLVVIVVPLKVLERYERLVSGAGLKIKNFEINALAIRRAFDKEIKGKSLIVDIHGSETNMAVYDGENLLMEKTLSLGGIKITRAISKKYNITVADAEIKKRENKEVEDYEFDELYRPVADDMLAEIGKVVSMLEMEFDYIPEEILLTGGDFNSRQMEDYFIENLAQIASTRVITPMAVLKSDNIDKSLGDRLRLANAVGLALKN